MFCPNCGKDCGEANFCSVCGQELSVEQTISEPPVGRYEAVDGYIDVSYYTMTIHKVVGTQSVETVIDYNDITDVIFREAHTSNGFLAIREEKDKLPPIKDEWDAACDEKTLVIEEGMNSAFHDVYMYLRQCSHVSAKKADQAQISAPNNSGFEKELCCPQCGSRKYFVHEHPYRHRFMHGKSLALAIMMCVLYFCYQFSSRRFEFVCLDCGHKWKK